MPSLFVLTSAREKIRKKKNGSITGYFQGAFALSLK